MTATLPARACRAQTDRDVELFNATHPAGSAIEFYTEHGGWRPTRTLGAAFLAEGKAVVRVQHTMSLVLLSQTRNS